MKCTHCQLPVQQAYTIAGDKKAIFCCLGCRSVYQILNQQGLAQHYYQLKSSDLQLSQMTPARFADKSNLYHHLDDKEFQKDHTIQSKQLNKALFYIEGIHCVACLWLLENLPKVLPAIKKSQLDLGRNLLELSYQPEFPLSQIAQCIHQWGYRPFPIAFNQKNQQVIEFKKKEEKKTLIRIGVAGFCAGNIMLYAVSHYGGAEYEYATVFNWVSYTLALPIFFFSAIPFYQSAWSRLSQKKISIDTPIAIALITGFIHGSFNFFNDIYHNYFDTLSILVFLLLLSRYLVKKMSERGLERSLLSSYFQNQSILKRNEQGEYTATASQYLKKEDIILFKPQQIAPADLLILQGTTQINTATLTGEPFPKTVQQGDHIQAGSENTGSEIKAKVIARMQESVWGQTLKQIESSWGNKNLLHHTLDLIAQRLISVVLIISALIIFYFYWRSDLFTGLERSLSLIIITCPCALGLIAPLVNIRALKQATSYGILIKDESSLEKIQQIQAIAFDKTGTITTGQLKVLNWPSQMTEEEQLKIANCVYHLEKKSHHPIALALKEICLFYFPQVEKMPSPFQEHKEVLSQGVFAQMGSSNYSLTSSTEVGVSELCLKIDFKCDDQILWTFELEDSLFHDSIDGLKRLKNQYQLHILSGDSKQRVQALAKRVGINQELAHYQLSPQQKANFIEQNNPILMVGDGANDGLALLKSHVSIAVNGSAEIGLKAADIYLTQPGIQSILDLISIANKAQKAIRSNLYFTLSYNLLGISAALFGLVTPLVAAIVMPISSLSVFLFTFSLSFSKKNY